MPYGTVNADLMTTSDGVSSAGLYGFKNRIINGACAINQRSTSLSTNNTGGYFVDRMWGFSGVSTAATFSQISSTGLAGFPNAARGQRNSGNTGTLNYYIGQIIESNNLQDLQGQAVTLSFWARCGANYSAPSSLAVVSISTGTVADQGLSSYLASTWTGLVNQQTTVTLTTSWQKFTYTVTLGSTIQELLFFIGSNTTSGTAGANDYIDITGVQLEKGSTATSFDYLDYGRSLIQCQRYLPALNNVNSNDQIGFGYSTNTTDSIIGINHPVTTRVPPTGVSVTSVSNILIGTGTGGSSAASAASFIFGGLNQTMVLFNRTGLTAGQGSFAKSNGAYQILLTGCEL